MSWGPNQSYGSGRGGIGTPAANILRNTLADGKVKIFQDEKHTLEKMQIDAPKGTVMIYKEYTPDRLQSKYKKIEIFSLENEPFGSLDIITDLQFLHPTYRFYYGTSPIGRGSGEIAAYIASKLLGDFSDPRLTAGSFVDQEVIETLQKMIEGKTI